MVSTSAEAPGHIKKKHFKYTRRHRVYRTVRVCFILTGRQQHDDEQAENGRGTASSGDDHRANVNETNAVQSDVHSVVDTREWAARGRKRKRR